jgi:hypothetical protein
MITLKQRWGEGGRSVNANRYEEEVTKGLDGDAKGVD